MMPTAEGAGQEDGHVARKQVHVLLSYRSCDAELNSLLGGSMTFSEALGRLAQEKSPAAGKQEATEEPKILMQQLGLCR